MPNPRATASNRQKTQNRKQPRYHFADVTINNSRGRDMSSAQNEEGAVGRKGAGRIVKEKEAGTQGQKSSVQGSVCGSGSGISS